MKVADQWEALFDLWHAKAHAKGPLEEKRQLWDRLKDLERDVIVLEAFMKAAKLDAAERARFYGVGGGSRDSRTNVSDPRRPRIRYV